MSMNIFVGNLSFRMTEEELQSLFSSEGEVASVRIIKDRESGLSRGFGFVEMMNQTEGLTAITTLNGREIQGRALRVNEAQAKEGGGERRDNNRGGFRPRSN